MNIPVTYTSYCCAYNLWPKTGCAPMHGLTEHQLCQVNPKGFPLQLFLTQRFFPVRFPWAHMPNPDHQCSTNTTSRSTQSQVLLIFPCKNHSPKVHISSTKKERQWQQDKCSSERECGKFQFRTPPTGSQHSHLGVISLLKYPSVRP